MDKNGLKRDIGLFPALATVMGTVIGGGVFFKAASVVSATKSANLTLFVWLLGGIITICAGLTVAELATALPQTGGAVKYIEYTYGKPWAFLLGWAQMLIYFPANVAALSIIFSTQLLNLFAIDHFWLIPIAILCGTSLTLVNLLGARFGGALQVVTLIFKLIPIALIVLFGFLAKNPVHFSLIPLTSGGHTSFAAALSSGLLATMFAYDGWLNVGTVAGELKNPQRDLPRAIILGLALITLIYVLINAVFLRTLPVAQIAGNLNTAADAAIRIFGNFGGKLVTLGILISVYGAINGYTMTGMRVPFALAYENQLPFSKQLKRLSKTKVPYVAGLFELAIAIIMMLVGSFDLLTDMLVFVIWIFSTMIFIAVFILRHRDPKLARPYKVPFYPIVPLVALLGGLFILIETLLTKPLLAVIGISITLLGLPVYYWHRAHSTEI
ncbi:APC family permease [Loigolactobacillus backii]|uniref:Amino acid permease n=1 Tax=Loigolactobacillus backii TaxID=375175 RepID=A0A192H638_9LACO|nr:amino acid permease [Loigolactobacillus backii]ANK60108.1 amino acid permease [Loigolactobacillus backii]ANK63456.1 amino acid permease [Loigolactobacillus backii]ANK64990.1 amino acid permease [Loigolactobacillus backii]ANK66509.1 amino acid permease [Loigolactobacillus backii]ANK69540.1 amino acid permease [Loigolactobacillus backii]